MGEKTKNITRAIFIIFTASAALFFILFNNAAASTDGVIINEVMYNPAGADNSSEKSSYEWVELKNISSEAQDIHSWEIRMNTYFPLLALTAPLPPGGFVVIFSGTGTNNNTDFLNGNIAYLYRNKSGSQLGDSSGDVSLYKSSVKNKTTIADFVAYGKIPSSNNTNYKHATDAGTWKMDSFVENVPEDKSVELKELSLYSDSSEDWQESYVSGGTPGKSNSKKSELLPEPPKNNPITYSSEIRLSELLPNPKGDDDTLEFIELENYSSQKIDIANWSLEDFKQNTDQIETKHTFTFTSDYCSKRINNCIIEPKSFLTVYSQDYSSKNLTLNNTGGDSVRFLDPNGKAASSVSYEDKNVPENSSYSFDTDENIWKWTSLLTPTKKNEFEKEVPSVSNTPEKTSYPQSVYINELLPDSQEEYIELYNSSEKDIDITGWILRDASKTGKYIFPAGAKIKGGDYFVARKSDFKFALNNSGAESVFFFDPDQILVSSASYFGSYKEMSYSFDGQSFRWSKFPTPGQENRFSQPLKIEKLIAPKKIYKNMPAVFDVNTDNPEDEKLKFVWDFGDGHKSYKKSPAHTYKKTGSYSVKLKVSGDLAATKDFSVEVEDFPHVDAVISKLSPNPKGRDSENEWVEVRNNSKKRINLKKWSIATGWDKLIDHPIRKKIVIQPGKSKKITRQLANFSLQNKKARVQLRYPDKKAAFTLNYNQKKSIPEETLYAKTDKKWRWIAAADISKENKNKDVLTENNIALAPIAVPKENIPAAIAENLNNTALRESFGYSESPEWKEKKERTAALLDSRDTPQNVSTNKRTAIINKLLSIKTVHATDEKYIFTNSAPEEHYAVKFMRRLEKKINYLMGKIMEKVF